MYPEGRRVTVTVGMLHLHCICHTCLQSRWVYRCTVLCKGHICLCRDGCRHMLEHTRGQHWHWRRGLLVQYFNKIAIQRKNRWQVDKKQLVYREYEYSLMSNSPFRDICQFWLELRSITKVIGYDYQICYNYKSNLLQLKYNSSWDNIKVHVHHNNLKICHTLRFRTILHIYFVPRKRHSDAMSILLPAQ